MSRQRRNLFSRIPLLILDRVLKPGGWVQIIDYYFMCQSDNGSLTDASALRQWSTKYICALDVTKNPRIPLQLQNMCNAAGLVNVEFRMIPIPLCGWSDGEHPYNLAQARLSPNTQRLIYEQIHGCDALVKRIKSWYRRL